MIQFYFVNLVCPCVLCTFTSCSCFSHLEFHLCLVVVPGFLALIVLVFLSLCLGFGGAGSGSTRHRCCWSPLLLAVLSLRARSWSLVRIAGSKSDPLSVHFFFLTLAELFVIFTGGISRRGQELKEVVVCVVVSEALIQLRQMGQMGRVWADYRTGMSKSAYNYLLVASQGSALNHVHQCPSPAK